MKVWKSTRSHQLGQFSMLVAADRRTVRQVVIAAMSRASPSVGGCGALSSSEGSSGGMRGRRGRAGRPRWTPTLSSSPARGRRHVRRTLAASAELLLPDGWEGAQLFYASIPNLGHDQAGHPEKAERVPAIMTALERYNLRGKGSLEPGLIELTGTREATVEEISAIHIPAYAKELPGICASKAPGILESGGPTYFTSDSSASAYMSAGAGMQLVDAVVESARARKAKGLEGSAAGFGVCRPPGHHAIPKGPMGFCLFNNISVMARYAQNTHNLKKVMIFDFDVHHGNGTHDAFYQDPSVLFVSTHQAGGYPGTGQVSEVGEGDGEGYTINLPLPGDSGDSAMKAAFSEVVEPAAQRFVPDIILVSAGYDAHWRDPLAGCQFRTSTYHWLTAAVKHMADSLCEGRVVFMLEGGYDLRALGESVSNSFLALMGKDVQDSFNPALLRDEPADRVKEVILECRRIHGL